MFKINKHIKQNRGMTYIELIVVMGIFASLTAVSLFNHGDFQAKIDIKNLANDIALRIVGAQRYSLSGKLPPATQYALIPVGNQTTWKPAYGLYFNMTTPASFISFVDADADSAYAGPTCSGECLEKVNITKGDFISKIESYIGATPTNIANPLSISFRRPDSAAIFKAGGVVLSGFDYVQITINTPKSLTSVIKVYPSGRIQVN